MLFALSFCFLFVLTFAALALSLRPSNEQQLLNRRLELLLPAAQRESNGPGTQPLLREAAMQQKTAFVSWLLQLAPAQKLARLVYQSTGSRSMLPTLASVLLLAAAGVIGVSVTTRMFSFAALVGVLCGSLPLVRLSHLRQKKLNAFNKALPDCIDICARALRAGHSLIAAIGIAAEQAPEPARSEFTDIFKKQNFGLSLREALLETLERLPSADFRVFVTGILVQKDTGGNLTEIFDRIVTVMRERLRIEGEIRIHTAQGRMTAWILTSLPPVLFVMINLLNPGYSRPMFADSTGRTLFYGGVVSLLIGGLVVRRIVNGIEV